MHNLFMVVVNTLTRFKFGGRYVFLINIKHTQLQKQSEQFWNRKNNQNKAFSNINTLNYLSMSDASVNGT